MRLVLAAALLLGACAPNAAPRAQPDPRRVVAAPLPPRVLVDTIDGCPQVTVDRLGRAYSVMRIDRDPEKLVVASLTAPAWSHERPGKTRYRAIADAHRGEGVAFAASVTEPSNGIVVTSFAPDGTERFTKRIAAPGPGDVPKVTAAALGPASEVTIAGVTTDGLDPDPMAFVARYTKSGIAIFDIVRKSQNETNPRIAASADGTTALAYTTREGIPTLEWLDSHGQTTMQSKLPGRTESIVSAGANDVVVASRRGDGIFEITRFSRKGDVVRTRQILGEFQSGALGARGNGDIWFGGWLGGETPSCPSAPAPAGGSNLPRLVVLSADGNRCRTFVVATRESRWDTPASLVESAPGRMLFATSYLGNVDLPGVSPLSAGRVGPRCAVMDLPADAPDYTP